MKIIDLLNKIANGKEAPKKIKYDNRVYIFDDTKDNYYENDTCSINWDYVAIYCLNEEVEILEEEKKIPEKLPVYDCIDAYSKFDTNDNRKAINEIIDYLDYLKRKGE